MVTPRERSVFVAAIVLVATPCHARIEIRDREITAEPLRAGPEAGRIGVVPWVVVYVRVGV
jgi:hypothetical protein